MTPKRIADQYHATFEDILQFDVDSNHVDDHMEDVLYMVQISTRI